MAAEVSVFNMFYINLRSILQILVINAKIKIEY